MLFLMERKITTIPSKKPSKPIRVAIYCRVSTPADEQQLSLDTQTGRYMELISHHPD